MLADFSPFSRGFTPAVCLPVQAPTCWKLQRVLMARDDQLWSTLTCRIVLAFLQQSPHLQEGMLFFDAKQQQRGHVIWGV